MKNVPFIHRTSNIYCRKKCSREYFQSRTEEMIGECREIYIEELHNV
jgi:hypothetical protein